MEALNIARTKSSPEIVFDPEKNVLSIRGESYPENAAAFYTQVFAWLEKYLLEPASGAGVVNVELTYFNSSSSKVFMNFFSRLDKASREGKAITVNWRYHPENESALECGQEFQEDMENLSFQLVALE